MKRSVLILAALLLALAAPVASAQEPSIGTAAAISNAPVKHDGVKIGDLTVYREGDAITATATFKGRPPGKTMQVCVTVAGDTHCATRKARRNGTVKLVTSADFTTPLTAKARSGAARGRLTL